MELLNTINQELLLPSTCFPASEGSETKTLTDLPTGSFTLSLVLKDDIKYLEESKVFSSFNVKKVEELLPEITFVQGVIKSVIEEKEKEGGYSVVKIESDKEIVVSAVEGHGFPTHRTNVQVRYVLGETLLQMDMFDVCLRLIDAKTNDVNIELACVSATQRTLTFQQMTVGSYLLSLTLAQKRVNANQEVDLYESSKVQIKIRIVPLEDKDMMPVIMVDNHMKHDLLLNDTMEVEVNFNVYGLESALSQVETCLILKKHNDLGTYLHTFVSTFFTTLFSDI
jgi:hypothetical protein